jgi:hypothetical protein
MQVNQGAPVMVRHEIEIFAPPEKIWEWLSRVDLWEDWRQDVSGSYWLNGRGGTASFKWRLRKLFGITARVEAWDEEREFGWTGQFWISTLKQVMRIDGDFRRTRIVMESSVEGALVRPAPLRAMVRSQLNRTNEIYLGSLKTKLEAEKPRDETGQRQRSTGSALRPELPSRNPRLR